jgi:SpoVK/Ycf46/Vps4 family AAA+-type ATPase
VVRQTAAADVPDGLWRTSQAFTRPRLDTYAQHLATPATWDDLVLPEPELRLLHRLVEQVRGRATVLRRWGLGAAVSGGTGVTALFAGQSGTGKTMAAGVVARALDLAMYRVDLSAVVSKYIGETERNLRQVFDAADAGGVLLLFDEADALFGQRSEVKDSHDRYANIEVNYLLQRMEDYRGVAVLTTNQRHAVDRAFLRRLRFVVTFPFPSPAQRRALWQRAFPADVPVAALDLDRLATLAATGGMVRNIALNTAYCAAGAGRPVTMDLVLEMARVEFDKLQLPVTEGDFVWREAVA